MRGKPLDKIASVPTSVVVALLLSVSPSQANSPAFYEKQDVELVDVNDNDVVENKAGVIRYGYFTDNSMNEAYTHQFGLLFFFSAEEPRNREQDTGVWFGLRIENGLLVAQGKPLQSYSNYDIVNQSLVMIALPLSLTFMRQIGDSDRDDFMTYWGLGFGFFFGFERMACHVTKETPLYIEHYEWHDTCYRHSFAGHGLLGASYSVSERVSFLCELRWTQGGKGRLKRANITEEGFEEVFAAFQHPDFNFTGVGIDLGVKW